MDACFGRSVGGGLAYEFSYADVNTFGLRSRYGYGVPSGGLQEGVFRACYELAGRGRLLRKLGRAVELVEDTQQVGLFQRHGYSLGTSHLEESLLHFIEPG